MLKNLTNHPPKLWLLLFGKLWDTFSYFGTQTIMVLYFIKVFHASHDTSFLIYGAYAALAFSTPIIGGIVADKFLGSRRALIWGGLLNISGNLLLILGHRSLFSLGLATTLIGSGLYKSNVTQLVGTLYAQGSTDKEVGYTWLYLASNTGGTLAPIIYGIVIYLFGWNIGFLCSALGISSGVALFILKWDKKAEKNNGRHEYFIFAGIMLLILFLSIPFYFTALINPILLSIFVIALIYLILMIYQHSGKTRLQLLAILLMSFAGMFYYAAGLQIGATITLFINQQIQLGTIHMVLPASVFSSCYCLFIIILAPIFTGLWRKLKNHQINIVAPTKLAIGIFLATLGITAFIIATTTHWIFTSIIAGNLLLSAGELVITPAMYTAISDFSPPMMRSTMMGCWFLFVAAGGYMSSLLARFAHFFTVMIPVSQSDYLGEFTLIALFTLGVALIVSLANSQLKKMLTIYHSSPKSHI